MKERITPDHVQVLTTNEIFVFGSNADGFHTSGTARMAIQWGAIMGQGVGLHGNTYAIPTTFQTVNEIKPYVVEFIQFAESHPEYTFLVTEIGCGHAGHEAKEIAPLFKDAAHIENIHLPEYFWQLINRSFAKRLKAIMDHYSITPLHFIAGLGLEPAYTMKLVMGTESPTVDALRKILVKYPAVDARWLLLGEGSLSGE